MKGMGKRTGKSRQSLPTRHLRPAPTRSGRGGPVGGASSPAERRRPALPPSPRSDDEGDVAVQSKGTRSREEKSK
jgi:hypothetical protein